MHRRYSRMGFIMSVSKGIHVLSLAAFALLAVPASLAQMYTHADGRGYLQQVAGRTGPHQPGLWAGREVNTVVGIVRSERRRWSSMFCASLRHIKSEHASTILRRSCRVQRAGSDIRHIHRLQQLLRTGWFLKNETRRDRRTWHRVPRLVKCSYRTWILPAELEREHDVDDHSQQDQDVDNKDSYPYPAVLF